MSIIISDHGVVFHSKLGSAKSLLVIPLCSIRTTKSAAFFLPLHTLFAACLTKAYKPAASKSTNPQCMLYKQPWSCIPLYSYKLHTYQVLCELSNSSTTRNSSELMYMKKMMHSCKHLLWSGSGSISCLSVLKKCECNTCSAHSLFALVLLFL